MKGTWSIIIHPGGSAASLTFTHLKLLTHEVYAPWKGMWFNHITVRTACLSHASRLLVPKWITVLLNRGQLACWHSWIKSANKRANKQVVHMDFPCRVPAAGHVTGRIIRVLTRNKEWKSPMAKSERVLYPQRLREKSFILPFSLLLLQPNFSWIGSSHLISVRLKKKKNS